MRDLFVVLSGVFQIACMIPYVIAVVRRESQPIMATWFIWATLDAIAMVSMYLKGVVTVQIVMAVFCAGSVALLTLKYGKPGISRLDKVCLVAAALAIGGWALSGDPMLAMLTSLSGIAIGMVPTLVSAWEDPRRESRLAWTIGSLASVFSMLAIKEWTLSGATQPVVFLIINGAVTAVLYLRPLFIKRPETA